MVILMTLLIILHKLDPLIRQTIAPLNHTLPESEERRNVHQPEGMTEDELTALYFEQLDEQGRPHSDPTRVQDQSYSDLVLLIEGSEFGLKKLHPMSSSWHDIGSTEGECNFWSQI